MKKYFLPVLLFALLGLHSFAYADDNSVFSADLKANGYDGPVSMPYGSAPILTWTSSNMASCTASQGGAPEMSMWDGAIGTSGTVQVSNLTNNATFMLSCKNSDGSAIVTDSVQIHIGFLVKPSIINITTQEPHGKFITGQTAYVLGKGFLPTDNSVNVGGLIGSPAIALSASSTDGQNLSFIVPALIPGTYGFWISNWNGISDFHLITILGTSDVTPVQATASVQTPIVPAVQTVPAASQTGASCTSLASDLKYKSRDANMNGGVSALQLFLQKNGDLDSAPSGYFGAMTLTAVKKFQGENGISPTGFVGPLTRAKIKTASCK